MAGSSVPSLEQEHLSHLHTALELVSLADAIVHSCLLPYCEHPEVAAISKDLDSLRVRMATLGQKVCEKELLRQEAAQN